MSGYLHRLADTAAGRHDSVHPRTGSIFASRLEERRAPLQGWEETERVTLAQPPHRQTVPPELEPPEPPRGVTPKSEHVPLLPKSVTPDRRAAAEALPFSPAVHDPAGSPADPFDGRSSQRGAEPEGRPLTADADVHVTVPESRRAGDAFRPVMKPPRASEALTGAARPRETPRHRHGAQASQQPDDIQIHIGRIEVVAVPPQPAPRAPKTPDRSLSLDAYLSRRDGRTR